MDREALKAAIQIIVEARRPLVLFPEGHITRTNDRLGTLLEGTAFIARSAARQRAKCTPPGHVVVHPVALKYFFEGDVARSVEPVLDDIEKRLSWQPQTRLPLQDRISKIGQALLCLKEIEYLGGTRTGSLESRLPALIDSILQPLEKEWVGGRREEAVVERAKVLRTAILPDLVSGEISEQERERRWRHLADVYLAQQIACYPADYLSAQATPERILETVERFEEDLTDTARIHRPLRAVIQIGEALAVGTDRDRSAGEDPIMVQIEEHLNRMLQEISSAK